MLFEVITKAILEGFSVLEVCRLLKINEADRVHKEMVNRGVIQPVEHIKRGLLDQESVKLHPEILKFLKYKHYSFARWCAGHDLEQGLASKMLQNPMVENNEDSEWVHSVAMRDFPYTYKKIYGIEPVGVKWFKTKEKQHFTYLQRWDKGKKMYLGTVLEFEKNFPDVYADKAADALKASQEQLRHFLAIKRIENAISEYS